LRERSDEAICGGLKLLVQIAPFGIKPVDKIDLLPAGAAFDFLLASDRAGRIETDFIINEPVNVLAVRKSRQQPFPMLIHSSLEIASNADIENSIVAVGQNVDAINLLHIFTSTTRYSFPRSARRAAVRGSRNDAGPGNCGERCTT